MDSSTARQQTELGGLAYSDEAGRHTYVTKGSRGSYGGWCGRFRKHNGGRQGSHPSFSADSREQRVGQDTNSLVDLRDCSRRAFGASFPA